MTDQDPKERVVIEHPGAGTAVMTRLQFEEIYKAKGWKIKSSEAADVEATAEALAKDGQDIDKMIRGQLEAALKKADQPTKGKIDELRDRLRKLGS